MRCSVVQRRLLEAEDPASPPAEVLNHLAVCGACRAWQRRAVQIDRNVPLIPVPASEPPADVLGKQPRVAGEPSGRVEGWRLRFLDAVRSPGAALRLTAAAAAVVLFAVSWWALSGPSVPPAPKKPLTGPDPLVAQLIKRDVRLAEARTPRERVEALADLADDLHAETRELASVAGPDDLGRLADLYGQVLREGIVQRAGALPKEERRKVLDPIADRLVRAGGEAERRAESVPAARGPLLALAAAAREADSRLRRLIRGETQ